MHADKDAHQQHLPLKILVAVSLVVVAGFHIGSVWKGHGFYRDIHLGTALHYASTKIDLAHTLIIGFNATGTPTIQEFPLWQATVAVVFKLFGEWWGWGNVVSLLFFFTSLYPLYQITKMHLGERTALWSLIFFLGQPLIFIYAGDAGADGMAITAAIWFWYFAVRMLEQPTLARWIPATLMGILSATTKLPFFMAAGLAVFFLLLKKWRLSIRHWMALGSVGVVSGLLFLIWTRYTDRLQANAVFPFVDLRTSSSSQMVWWYFGDWAYRLSPKYWVKGAWRALNALFGSFIMLGLVFYAWRRRGDNSFAKFAVLGGALTTLLFSHLVLTHSHYYLMFTAAIAILSAQAATSIEEKLCSTNQQHSGLTVVFVGILLGLCLLQGLIGMKVTLCYDNYPDKIAKIVQKYTGESDKLVIQGGGWGGDILMRSNRNGLSIWTTEIFEKPENYQKLKSLGFDKLVMISESPLLTAIQKVNPGQADQERILYSKSATPIINGWPTVYQTEDVLIKEIP